jgi:hypothetical protein
MNIRPSTPRVKGPAVWLDMDQQALDEAYDQEIWAPNRALIVERRKAASEQARGILGAPNRVAYGPSEHEGLDIFDCGTRGAPVNVFVHGGAWRRNVAADYALQPSRWCAPARIPSSSTSSTSISPEAISSRCTSRCVARSPGCGATPKASAATATGFTFRRIRRAPISAAWC